MQNEECSLRLYQQSEESEVMTMHIPFQCRIQSMSSKDSLADKQTLENTISTHNIQEPYFQKEPGCSQYTYEEGKLSLVMEGRFIHHDSVHRTGSKNDSTIISHSDS